MGFFSKFAKRMQKPTLQNDILVAKNWILEELKSAGYQADFTLNSLKDMDRLYAEQCNPEGLLGEKSGRYLFGLGVYLGEVLMQECGGEWITDEDDPKAQLNVAVKLSDETMAYPVQRTMSRFLNGESYGIYDYGAAYVENCKIKG